MDDLGFSKDTRQTIGIVWLMCAAIRSLWDNFFGKIGHRTLKVGSLCQRTCKMEQFAVGHQRCCQICSWTPRRIKYSFLDKEREQARNVIFTPGSFFFPISFSAQAKPRLLHGRCLHGHAPSSMGERLNLYSLINCGIIRSTYNVNRKEHIYSYSRMHLGKREK